MPQMEVLKQDCVSISTINVGTGSKEAGITIFELSILSIMEFYGVEWTPGQIRECAEMVYADCYWFSLAELKHFVLKVKKAAFKPLADYSKLAPKHICACAEIYASDCLFARANFNFPKPTPKPVDERKLIEVDVVGELRKVIKQLQDEERAVKEQQAAERRQKHIERLYAGLENLKGELNETEYNKVLADIKELEK